MKLIFIAGSWGSGTTSVIGALDSLGIPTFGPHFQSNDHKTKNTYELQPFRALISHFVNEEPIQVRNNYKTEFIPALQHFKETLEKST
ncbi:MAG: hypothetical protein P8H03_05215 [Emcibacteraceae bacterium]|nr:hypothetical protein [Emcibacteraceae bacterium]